MNAEVRELGQEFQCISSIRNLFPATKNNLISSTINLVASADKFGLVFVAFGCDLKVYQISNLIDDDNTDAFAECTLPAKITYLAVNCDKFSLIVAGNNLIGLPFAFYFDTRVFAQKLQSYKYFYAAPLSAFENACVESIAWNPTDPSCAAVAINSGEISLIQIKEKSVCYVTTSIGASYVAWSNKGKQLAVGTTKGTLHLFNTNLEPVRIVQPPQLANICAVISIIWFSNTEFFVCYSKKTSFPSIFYVTAPKNGAATYINMDDICYSADNSIRPHSYYSLYIAEWSILFALSSHSSELGMLGKSANNPSAWSQWIPEEGYRGALQFIDVLEETFPIGFCSVFSSQKRFRRQDESWKGPFPAFLSLSTGGQLNIFHVENNISASKLTIIAEQLQLSGARTNEQYGTTITTCPSPAASQVVPNKLLENINTSTSASLNINGLQNQAAPPANTVQPKPVSAINQTPTEKGSRQIFESISPASPINQANISVASNFATSTPLLGQINKTNVVSQQPFNSQHIQSSSTKSQFVGQPLQNISSTPKSQFVGQPLQNNNTVGKPSFAVHPIQSNISIEKPNFVVQPIQNASITSQIAVLPAKVAAPTLTQAPLNGQAVAPISTQQTICAPVAKQDLVNGMPKRVKAKLIQQITAELVDFENEVITHGKTNSQIDFNAGNDDDKKAIATVLSSMGSWMGDMKSTIKEQNIEISKLHEGSLENCALYEDAKVQGQSNKSERNQKYNQLRPLDPYSRRKLEEIRCKYKYLQNQISEVNDMLDSEWQNHNSHKNKSSEECFGRQSEKIHRSVVNLRKMRLAVESQVDQLCQQIMRHNIHNVLLPNENNNNGTQSVDANMSKISSKNLGNLIHLISERKQTPVRHFSTPKKDMNIDDLSFKLNLDELPLSDFSSNQNHLLALKSFVGNTQQKDQSNILKKSTEVGQPSQVQNLAATDPALWQQYAMSPMSANLPPVQKTTSQSSTILSTGGSSENFGLKPSYPTAALPTGQMFQGASFSAGIFPGQKSTFTIASNVQNIAPPVQSPKTATMFKLPFDQPAVIPSTVNSQTLFTLSTPTNIGQSLEGINTTSISPKFTNQSPFSFSTNFSAAPPSQSLGSILKPKSQSSTVTPAVEVKTDTKITSVKDVETALIVKTSANSNISFVPVVSQKAAEQSINPPFGATATPFSCSIFGNNSVLFSSPFSQKSVLCSAVSAVSSVPTFDNVQITDSDVKNTSSVNSITTSPNQLSIKSSSDTKDIAINIPAVAKLSPSVLANQSVRSINSSIVFTPSSATGTFSSTKTSVGIEPTTVNISPNITGNNKKNTSVPELPESSTTFGRSSPKILIATVGTSSITISDPPVTSATVSNNVNSGNALDKNNSTSFGISESSVAKPNSAVSENIVSSSDVIANHTNTTSSSIIFGNNNSTTSTSSIFGINAITTSSTNVFGNNVVTSSSVFGNNTVTTSSVYGSTTATIASVFGSNTVGTSSVFGNNATSTSSTNIFGTNTANNSESGVFGNSPMSSTVFENKVCSTSAFGNNTPNSTGFSVFGNNATTTSNSSVFGGSASFTSTSLGGVSTTGSSSVFGSGNVPNSSVFGGSARGAVFGNTTSAQSIFGSGTTSTTPSTFGGTSSSVFGGQSVTSVANSFGNQSSFGNSSNSVAFTSGSFGGAPAKSASGQNNMFGNSQDSSPFGSNPSGSPFSSTKPDNTVFGGTSNNNATSFGAASGSAFGGSGSSTSAFSNEADGSKGCSVFGNNTSSEKSAFSGLQIFSDLGKSPTPAKASQNVFGAIPSGNTNTTSIFAPNSGQPVASPFGTPKTTASAFGVSSSFGGPSSFGSTAAFGGGNVFGGTASSGTQPTVQSFQNNPKSVFGNQAESSSFGSLAQEQNSGSFEKPMFGGNAFSSWRS